MKIEGYCCHFGKENLNGETVTQSAFDECLMVYHERQRMPLLTYNHDGTIIGSITRLCPDSVGLWMEATILEELNVVRDYVLPLVRGNVLNSFSTEGYIEHGDFEKHENGSYTANKVYLTAVSVVPMPADNDARFKIANKWQQVKSGEGLHMMNKYCGFEEEQQQKKNKSIYIYKF